MRVLRHYDLKRWDSYPLHAWLHKPQGTRLTCLCGRVHAWKRAKALRCVCGKWHLKDASAYPARSLRVPAGSR